MTRLSSCPDQFYLRARNPLASRVSSQEAVVALEEMTAAEAETEVASEEARVADSEATTEAAASEVEIEVASVEAFLEVVVNEATNHTRIN